MSAFVGCASNPQPPEVPTRLNPQHAVSQQVTQATGQAKFNLQLQAAEKYLNSHNIEQAQAIIDNMPERELVAECYVKRAWINSQIASLHGNYFLTRDLLSSKKLLADLPQISPELAIKVHESRAQFLFDGAEYQNALHERLVLAERLTSQLPLQRDKNDAAIWQILMEMPAAELASGPVSESLSNRQTIAQGWYALAIASRDHLGDLNAQYAAVNVWLNAWPQHPAAKRLPADLSQIKQLLTTQPKHIAVLLPQSGKLDAAVSAIRNGIMAAWYQQPNRPSLRFYNTEGRATAEVYDAAVSDGAELIIGPLEKERVAELAARPTLNIPTLALNTLDTPTHASPLFYQLGLSLEDEAAQVAADAWRQGKRQALLLAPRNSMGDRNLASFTQAWQQLGGKVLHEFRYGANNDFGELIKHALQVDQSEERGRQIQQIVGPLQASPQHRRDVDFIFAITPPEQARQLKPALAFYFCDDLPVFTTSNVFSGDNQAALNQDMAGIRFLTLPWYFATSSAEKNSLHAAGETSGNYARLNALGVDAFNLSARLAQFQNHKNTRYYGYTGTLQLNMQGQFEREQIWATFTRAGVAQPISAAGDTENTPAGP